MICEECKDEIRSTVMSAKGKRGELASLNQVEFCNLLVRVHACVHLLCQKSRREVEEEVQKWVEFD